MRLVLILFLCILGSTSSYAQLMVEPIVGYQFSGTSGIGGDQKNIKGQSFGGRFGYSNFGFMGGVELLTAKLNRSGQTSSITSNDAGMFVGFETLFGLRGWLTLVFMGTYSYDSSNYDGTGTKLGLGYSPVPFFSLNMEYKSMNYFRLNEKEIDSEVRMHALVVSLSVPLRF